MLNDVLEQQWLGNTPREWGVAVLIAVATIAAIRLIKGLVASRLERIASKRAATTRIRLDDLLVQTLDRTRWYFYLILGITLGGQSLEVSPRAERILDTLMVFVLLLQVGIWVQSMVRRGVEHWRASHEQPVGRDATFASAVGFIGQLVTWSVLFILALSNLGIEISALLAGLGIGGIAAALAVQSVLGDLLASLSIYFDRPFDIGDFIIVDDLMGSVDRVGLRTTRVRSLGGEQLVFPNSHLTASRIRNFGRMQERRVVFRIGIIYSTPYEKVARIPKMIREVVDQTPETRFDRCHFQGYGDSSLVYETVFHVLSPDFNVYMDRQEQINLEIYRQFEEENISFAFPTRTLHVHSADARPIPEANVPATQPASAEESSRSAPHRDPAQARRS